MAGRLSVACVSFLAVLAFLLLFASGTHVEAATYKMGYGGGMSCAGLDKSYGTGDDSCVEDATYGAYGENLHADLVSYFDVFLADPKYSMYETLATMGTPATWQISTDKEIPDGAYVGEVVAVSTLALFGGACTTPNVVVIPLHDCSTDITDTISWDAATSGENLTYGDEDGLPAGCLQYPQHVLDIVGDVKPRARYYGFTTVIEGMSPTQLNFMMFNPGALTGKGDDASSTADAPRDDFTDDLGYINFTVLDNPNIPAAPGALDELCTPLGTTTTLLGLTGGEATLNTDVSPDYVPEEAGTFWTVGETCGDTADSPNAFNDGCPAVGPADCPGPLPCADCDANEDGDCLDVGEAAKCNETACPDADGEAPWDNCDDDADGFINDGCPIVGTSGETRAACANNLDDEPDNNADHRVDEVCGIVRVTNPAANSGIYGTGSHMAGGYSESYRDADGDTIANNEDECPYDADVGTPSAFTHIDSACGNTTPCTTAGGTAEDADGDGWRNQADNCPCVSQTSQANDDDGDNIGDECDTDMGTQTPPNGGLVPDGEFLNDFQWGSICIDADDSDGDGWCDETEDLLGYVGAEALSVSSTTPEGGTETARDANPVNKVGDCVDGLDNDGDTYADSVNAGVCVSGGPGTYPTAGYGCDAGCSTPEYYGTDWEVNTTGENPPGVAPQSCDNWSYYDVNSIEDHGGMAPPIDDDGDTVVNAADLNCGVCEMTDKINDGCTQVGATAETGTQCDDALDSDTTDNAAGRNESDIVGACANFTDDDGDTVVNDGCPIVGDGYVNDGCPALGPPETLTDCDNATDDDGDTLVNDGCPMQGSFADCDSDEGGTCDPGAEVALCYNATDDETGTDATAAEAGGQCTNTTDDDFDGLRNDGCPQVGDGYVNDGCTTVGAIAEAAGAECANAADDDGDPDCDGIRNADDNCPDVANPTQQNTDGLADGGDACDLDDDEDKLKDTDEWAQGSDPKNRCDPRDMDLLHDNQKISIMDVLVFSNKVMAKTCIAPKDYLICEAIYRDDP